MDISVIPLTGGYAEAAVHWSLKETAGATRCLKEVAYTDFAQFSGHNTGSIQGNIRFNEIWSPLNVAIEVLGRVSLPEAVLFSLDTTLQFNRSGARG